MIPVDRTRLEDTLDRHLCHRLDPLDTDKSVTEERSVAMIVSKYPDDRDYRMRKGDYCSTRDHCQM
jgi:hypothetical protein